MDQLKLVRPPMPKDTSIPKAAFTVVSFFTKDTLYEKYAEILKTSLEKFGIPYYIEAVPNLGDWNKNTQLKPNIILKYLLNLKSPVLWLDCDCEVLAPLSQLEEVVTVNPIDFAVYNWYGDDKGNQLKELDPSKLLCSGGTMYFNYSVSALNLMIRWMHNTNTNPGVAEDLLLDSAFNEDKTGVNACWLPKAFNRMEAHWPDEPPIIDHKWYNGNLFNGKEEVKQGN